MHNKKDFDLAVVYRPIGALLPHPSNARTHSKHQLRQIASSIDTFGFTNPILISANNTIIAGHGRVAAARQLGIREVPTIRLENLNEDQIRAYLIADNVLAEKAGWDKSILAIELQHLITLESKIDVTLTGLEIPEVDLIIEQARPAVSEGSHEDFAFSSSGRQVTEVGDLWQLDKHRLICGNSLNVRTFEGLMGNKRASVVFVDPPYNVPIDGHAGGNGSIHHRDFAMASGEMSPNEFEAFLATSLCLLGRFSRSGSLHFICMDWRHMVELLSAGKHVYDLLLNLCVWAKDNGGMGSFYRSRHELIFVYRRGKARHRNNIQLGQYGRNRTNVWEYPGVNTASRQGEDGSLLSLHPTVKPVALVADALLDCSARGDIVLDSFLGSGTSLMAAERIGRVCFGIEIDPLYVDVAIRRWQKYTGRHATHAVTGKRFDELSEVTRGQ